MTIIDQILEFFKMDAKAGWWLSVSILLFAILVAGVVWLLRYKRARFWTIPRCLAVGIFASAVCYFFFYYFRLKGTDVGTAILNTLWRTLQLYVLDGDAGHIDDLLKCVATSDQITAELLDLYRYYGYVLRVLAPVTTFAFLLTFVKNIYAHFLYFFQKPWTDTHVFSELNEKSLALAENLKRYPFGVEVTKSKNIFVRAWYAFAGWIMSPTIVFTDVTDKREEENLEWVDKAKEIGAILFRKDLEAIRHKRYISPKRQCIYLISDDEPEKVRHTINIIEKCKKQSKVTLYVFSDKVESRVMLNSHTRKERREMRMEVIRVNDARALIYHNLDVGGDEKPKKKKDTPFFPKDKSYKSDAMGLRLFEKAVKIDEKNRVISAVIVGLGRYGMEMLKALLWYCQIPGYSVKITALDEAKDIKCRFRAMCPEIVPGKVYDGPGDMRYEINVKSVKVGTKKFLEEIESVKDVTYIFVGLGQDDMNLSTALSIENYMAALGRDPDIDTVVYNSDLAEQMRDKWAEDLQILRESEKEENLPQSPRCRVRIIGDLKSFYSAGTVIASKLDEEGFEVHLRWEINKKQKMPKRKEERLKEKIRKQYHMQDYGYFSSLASALHRRLRRRILQYREGDAYCREVFPAFRRPGNDDTPEERAQRVMIEDMLKSICDSDSTRELSFEMQDYERCMNARMGYIYYQALENNDKITVRSMLLEKLRKIDDKRKRKKLTRKERKKEPPLGLSLVGKLASEEKYLELLDKYEKQHDDDKEALALVKTCIVEFAIEAASQSSEPDKPDARSIELQYEYDMLTRDQKADVAAYVDAHVSNGSMHFNKFMLCVKSFSYLEHIRWNAYIRTEGFRQSAYKDNDHKLHRLIIPVDQLTLKEKIKDI
ncbi:MAG: DUF4381 domain-containing protein [Ruminococcaceae bacterium]|nr:DUF4381 domain-containing protein [Oscillospiraceae bacterium]